MYRILTEDTNRPNIVAALTGIDAYTLFNAQGSWKGVPENSLAIELDGVDRETVTRIARAIKESNHQDAVLIQEFPVTSNLV